MKNKKTNIERTKHLYQLDDPNDSYYSDPDVINHHEHTRLIVLIFILVSLIIYCLYEPVYKLYIGLQPPNIELIINDNIPLLSQNSPVLISFDDRLSDAASKNRKSFQLVSLTEKKTSSHIMYTGQIRNNQNEKYKSITLDFRFMNDEGKILEHLRYTELYVSEYETFIFNVPTLNTDTKRLNIERINISKD